MRIIITESIINEIGIKNKEIGNFFDTHSHVYSGKNIVKKFPKKRKEFNEVELLCFNIMSNYPNIFVWTKIINKSMVIQKKVDVLLAYRDYESLDNYFIDNQLGGSFETYLELLGTFGKESSARNRLKKAFFDSNPDTNLIKIFNEFNLWGVKMNYVYKKHKDSLARKSLDLNSGNFGYDNGKLKCFDFIIAL